MTLSPGQWTTKCRKLFKVQLLHGFLSNKTGMSELTWNWTWIYSSAVCGSSPQWPCSITGLAVVVFIAFPFVYSPVFS